MNDIFAVYEIWQRRPHSQQLGYSRELVSGWSN